MVISVSSKLAKVLAEWWAAVKFGKGRFIVGERGTFGDIGSKTRIFARIFEANNRTAINNASNLQYNVIYILPSFSLHSRVRQL